MSFACVQARMAARRKLRVVRLRSLIAEEEIRAARRQRQWQRGGGKGRRKRKLSTSKEKRRRNTRLISGAFTLLFPLSLSFSSQFFLFSLHFSLLSPSPLLWRAAAAADKQEADRERKVCLSLQQQQPTDHKREKPCCTFSSDISLFSLPRCCVALAVLELCSSIRKKTRKERREEKKS